MHISNVSPAGTSRSWHWEAFGKLESLRLRSGPVPSPGPKQVLVAIRASSLNRRDVMVAGLNKIKGFSCRSPKGAFYVFPNVKRTGWASKKLADALLEDAGVAALSGTAFGEFGEGYLRFSVANSIQNIEKALDRVDAWVKKNL